MDNIKTWTGLSVEESVRMTEDREINGESTSMVWPTLGSRTAKELNRTSSREERRRSGCAEGSTSTTRPDAHEIFSLYEEEAISFDKAI